MIADPFATLSSREWSVLDALQDADRPLAAVTLIDDLDVGKSSVYSALGRLVELGLADRRRDGRRHRYTATALGVSRRRAVDAVDPFVALRSERDDLASELVEIADLVGAADHEEVVGKVRDLVRRAEAPLPRLRDALAERVFGWLL